MRMSNAREIIAMTIMWAAALMWFDNIFSQNKLALTAEPVQIFSPSQANPRITLRTHHVACGDQDKQIVQALNKLQWFDHLQVRRMPHEMPTETGTPPEQAAEPPPGAQCVIEVVAQVRDVKSVNFVVLTRALRNIGMVPAELDLGGLPYFALKAGLSNLNCDGCGRAALRALTPRNNPQSGTAFKWLRSTRLNLKENTVTALVRENSVASVEEMQGALERAGIGLLSLRILYE